MAAIGDRMSDWNQMSSITRSPILYKGDPHFMKSFDSNLKPSSNQESPRSTNGRYFHQDQYTILSTLVTMAMAKAATTTSSGLPCDCGGDHGQTVSRVCPVFEIMSHLNKSVKEFRDIQQILDFGKDGPMARSLRLELGWKLSETTDQFNQYEQLSEKHPEWELTEKMSKLWRYFNQVSDRCMDDEGIPGIRLLSPVLPDNLDIQKSALWMAKIRTGSCYSACCKVVRQCVRNGAVPLSGTKDHEGSLQRVDKVFKEAVDAILLLGSHENSTIQGLMQQSYECWKESRRLLCDFKRPPREVIE